FLKLADPSVEIGQNRPQFLRGRVILSLEIADSLPKRLVDRLVDFLQSTRKGVHLIGYFLHQCLHDLVVLVDTGLKLLDLLLRGDQVRLKTKYVLVLRIGGTRRENEQQAPKKPVFLHVNVLMDFEKKRPGDSSGNTTGLGPGTPAALCHS